MAELCNSCEIERIGCGCDGAYDDGCFRCAPSRHVRPPCPETCPNFNPTDISHVRMALPDSLPDVSTPTPAAFTEVLKSVVFKTTGHVQLPMSEDYIRDAKQHPSQRLYTVVSISPGKGFGGNVTVAVCDSFESAVEIVEINDPNAIYEYTYSLVVIEAIASNYLMYPLEEQYWYCWVDGAGYKPIECPKAFEQFFGF
jgi:hypothetical protein